tara:strand:- start:677 stop:937 length:261 start_codon:yes stop_codon:yes gene_type:complete
MIKKIFNSLTSLLTIALIFSSTLFSAINPVLADQAITNRDAEKQINIETEESVNSSDSSTANAVPDLGDELTFPFIPGFGKNSGKD